MDLLVKLIGPLLGSINLANVGTLLLAVAPFLPGAWSQVAMAVGAALLGKSISASNAQIAATNQAMADQEAAGQPPSTLPYRRA